MSMPILSRRRWRWFLSVRQYLLIVPIILVIFQWSVKWREFPVHDRLRHDLLVPVSRAGVDPLRHQMTVVYSFVVRITRGRRRIAHGERVKLG